MKKTFYFLCCAFLLAGSASAQSVKENIDKAIKHPDREKNAAHADRQLIDKKKISDSTTPVASTTPTKKQKKKKLAKKTRQ